MSTVPTPDTPAPANNAKTLLLSSDENLYVRPTAGGNASHTVDSPPGSAPGTGGPGAGAGPTPGYSINMAGVSPNEGGTQAGPDMGHGATQILSGISGPGDTDNDGDTL